MITEAFLHYVWAYQQFNKKNLSGSHNETLQILKTGHANTNAGPDFLNGKIDINGIVWAGQIELHIKSSDWLAHNHSKDPAYNNVILHVVWQHDKPILTTEGQEIPTLELKGLVPKSKLTAFTNLMNTKTNFACQNRFNDIKELTKLELLDKAAANRLERKGEELKGFFKNGDWEQLAYLVLAKNFGFKLNSEAFVKLAMGLPLSVLKKLNGQHKAIEALLFGMAGFLERPEDNYSEELKTEYTHLMAKFKLPSNYMQAFEWKFMRTRLGNFPTVRIAQFAALLAGNPSLFSLLTTSPQNLKGIKVTEYWNTHYNFGKKRKKKGGSMGQTSINVLLINSAALLTNFYGTYTDNPAFNKKAQELLEGIKPEKNNIISKWESMGLKAASAFDSQAMIEQYNEYCTKKKCLSCVVGVKLMGENYP